MSDNYRKDEYKKVRIPFGFNDKLERVLLSLFHTFFVAMTGHGKTLGMKSLLLRFHELFPDWKILIIDSKDKRDYADLKADIPICFVETTEPLELKNLLEPILGAKMIYFFDKIIEEATFDTLGEMQRSIEKKIVDADEGRIKIHGKELGKLRVINHLLKKLVVLVERPNIISELKLHDGFNVMSVSLPEVKSPNLKKAFQQLIVKSVLILLLSDPSYERTLLVLDENHKWNPQRYPSICKQPLSEYIAEGRSQDKIVWMADQALTKVDKESLKNVKIWVVGQQMEDNEVEDAANTVNDITDLRVSDREIKTLKVGNFILVDGLHGTVERVYLQPHGVPDEIALQIVKEGNPDLAESYIIEYEKSRVSEDTNLDYKQAWEEEKQRRELAEEETKAVKLEKQRLDQEFTRQVERLSDLKSQQKIEALKQEMAKTFVPRAELKATEDKLATLEKEQEQLKKDAEFGRRLKELFKEFLPTATPTTDMPTAVGLQRVVTVVELDEIKKHVPKVPTDTVKGKILALAREGFFDDWQNVGDVNTKLVDAFRFNTSDQAINGALKELVGEQILGMKYTNRNHWKLAPNVIFEGKEVKTKP